MDSKNIYYVKVVDSLLEVEKGLLGISTVIRGCAKEMLEMPRIVNWGLKVCKMKFSDFRW